MRFVLQYMIILFFNVLLTQFGALLPNPNINGIITQNDIFHKRIITDNYEGLKTIVIDPGHGGKDNGTSYGKYREKRITLQIAFELKRQLERMMPELNVVLTRTDDVFIPLHQRIDIANKLNADLFISLHCNSYKEDNHINGIEVFTLGVTESEDNLDVALRENASVLLEKDHQNNYDWYNPNSIEAHIFLAAFQNIHMGESVLLASKIGNYLQDINRMKDRGVKQSGFVILKEAAMPSVLVEMGFLSNASDRKKLTTKSGQKSIARAISKAVTVYFNR